MHISGKIGSEIVRAYSHSELLYSAKVKFIQPFVHRMTMHGDEVNRNTDTFFLQQRYEFIPFNV